MASLSASTCSPSPISGATAAPPMCRGMRVKGLLADGTAGLVADAPVIAQPVFVATHMRRRTSVSVRKAVKALHELVADGAHGNAGVASGH